MPVSGSYLINCMDMDHNLTERMRGWLAMEGHDRASIMDGALMVLKLNRNKVLYNTIAQRPEKYEAKVRYELSKHLPMRLDEKTKADVAALEKEVMPPVKAAVELGVDAQEDGTDVYVAAGKREDHDSLPDNIKALWDGNAERWKKIKEIYNLCLQLDKPCDRYEYLKILKEEWYAYKEAFEAYDGFTEGATEDEEGETAAAQATVKDITNARAYISKNLDRLIGMERTDEKFAGLYAKVLERVRVIKDSGEGFSADMEEKLSRVFPEIVFDETHKPDTETAAE